MAQILKDNLGLCEMINRDQEIIARKHGLPVMRGVLYKVNMDSNGDPIFDKLEKVNENTVVLGGAVLALEKLFGRGAKYLPGTLNEEYKVNDAFDVNPQQTYIRCFGVGTGGARDTIGSVLDPDFKQKFLNDMIPFRISDTEDLADTIDPEVAKKYFFRRQIYENPKPLWGWYLKEFENPDSIPQPSSYWKDVPDPNSLGTEVSSNPEPYTLIGENDNLIECFGECIIKLEEDDLRPWFQYNGSLPTARYNTFGLFTGAKTPIVSGYVDYVGVRLFSVVNFNNVALDMPTSATYLYRVYAAI